MAMLCPRCRKALISRPHATGMIWECPRCAGQSLNFSQFRKLLPRFQANEIWLTVMEHPVIPRRRAFCPECRKAMAAVLIPMESGGTELDVCPPCQRLWMDSPMAGPKLLEGGGELSPGLREELPVVKMEGRRQERRVARREAGGGDFREHSPFFTRLEDLAVYAIRWLWRICRR